MTVAARAGLPKLRPGRPGQEVGTSSEHPVGRWSRRPLSPTAAPAPGHCWVPSRESVGSDGVSEHSQVGEQLRGVGSETGAWNSLRWAEGAPQDGSGGAQGRAHHPGVRVPHNRM